MTSRDQELQNWTGGTLKNNKVDRNELQVRKNLHKGTGTKMTEKLNNMKNWTEKKNQIHPCA